MILCCHSHCIVVGGGSGGLGTSCWLFCRAPPRTRSAGSGPSLKALPRRGIVAAPAKRARACGPGAGLATRSCQLGGGAAGRWAGARRWVGGLFSSRAVSRMCAIRAKKRTNFYYERYLPIRPGSSVPSRCSGATWAGAKPLAASKRLQLNDNGHAAPEISGPEIASITQFGRNTHESLGRTQKWLAGGHQRVQQGHQVGLTLGRRLRLHRKAFGAVVRHSRGVTKSDPKKSLNSQNPPTLSQPR